MDVVSRCAGAHGHGQDGTQAAVDDVEDPRECACFVAARDCGLWRTSVSHDLRASSTRTKSITI